jgi:hypothetical protein
MKKTSNHPGVRTEVGLGKLGGGLGEAWRWALGGRRGACGGGRLAMEAMEGEVEGLAREGVGTRVEAKEERGEEVGVRVETRAREGEVEGLDEQSK